LIRPKIGIIVEHAIDALLLIFSFGANSGMYEYVYLYVYILYGTNVPAGLWAPFKRECIYLSIYSPLLSYYPLTQSDG
jgi:hypothetical protein